MANAWSNGGRVGWTFPLQLLLLIATPTIIQGSTTGSWLRRRSLQNCVYSHEDGLHCDTSTSTTASANTGNDSNNSGPSPVATAFAVIGPVLFLALVALGIWWLWKKGCWPKCGWCLRPNKLGGVQPIEQQQKATKTTTERGRQREARRSTAVSQKQAKETKNTTKNGNGGTATTGMFCCGM